MISINAPLNFIIILPATYALKWSADQTQEILKTSLIINILTFSKNKSNKRFALSMQNSYYKIYSKLFNFYLPELNKSLRDKISLDKKLVGIPRIELGPREPESRVLPLYYIPKNSSILKQYKQKLIANNQLATTFSINSYQPRFLSLE